MPCGWNNAGSVVVRFTLVPGREGGSPVALAARLAEMMDDPGSQLFKGALLSKLKKGTGLGSSGRVQQQNPRLALCGAHS